MELTLEAICDLNALVAAGISGLTITDNGGDTGSASTSVGLSKDTKDVFDAMTSKFGSPSYSFKYKGGIDTTSPTQLTVKIDDGLGGDSGYVVNGWKVDRAIDIITVVASSDNYVDVKEDGEYTVTTVALAAPEPAVAADALRLYKFVTDGVGVVSAEDRATQFAFDGTTFTDDSILTRHLRNLSVTGAKMEDIVTGATIGSTDIFSLTFDDKGRVTAGSDKISITALTNLDILQYRVDTGKWENVAITGSILPAATVNQTLYYDGISYLASSLLTNTGGTVGIGINDGVAQESLTPGATRTLAQNLKKPRITGVTPTGGGSMSANTYYYVLIAKDGVGGITVKSNEASASVDGAITTAVDFLFDDIPLAASFTMYRGTSTGVYVEKIDGIVGTTFTDDGTGWGATANPTHINTNAYGWKLSASGLIVGSHNDIKSLVGVANVNKEKLHAGLFTQALVDDAAAETFAIKVTNSSVATTFENYGVSATVNGSEIENIGIYANATTAGVGDNVAIYGEADNSGAGDGYAIRLTDGTEQTGRFLKCIDDFGRGQWFRAVTAATPTLNRMAKWSDVTQEIIDTSNIEDDGSEIKFINTGIGSANAMFDTAGSLSLNTAGSIATANGAALIELNSTTKGLLLSRMTAVQGSAITPVDGLVIYITTTDATFTSAGFWGYEAGVWIQF
jgi:hypothetical protein